MLLLGIIWSCLIIANVSRRLIELLSCLVIFYCGDCKIELMLKAPEMKIHVIGFANGLSLSV